MQNRTKKQYESNSKIHYQDLTNKIYIDDFDFGIGIWALLIKQIIKLFGQIIMNKEV